MKEYKITVKDNIDEITTINHDNLQELFSCRGNFFYQVPSISGKSLTSH